MDENLRKYERNRVAIRRKNMRLLKALKNLFDGGIIESTELETYRKKVEEFFRAAKAQRLADRPFEPGKAGRPVRVNTKCRRPGCDQPAKNGYCSREHAPLGAWGEYGPAAKEVR